MTGSGSPAQTVEAFLDALGRGDLDTATALLAPDVEHETVSMVRVRGRAATRRMLESLTGMVTLEVGATDRLAVDGRLVIGERTDALGLGPLRAAFRTCGIFEVVEGRITFWRDYFDWCALLGGIAGTLGRAVVPAALRPGSA